MQKAEIITLGAHETMAQFITREGCVTTASVMHRFGIPDHREALRKLHALERAGFIRSEVQPVSYQGCGTRARVWCAAKSDSETSP